MWPGALIDEEHIQEREIKAAGIQDNLTLNSQTVCSATDTQFFLSAYMQ